MIWGEEWEDYHKLVTNLKSHKISNQISINYPLNFKVVVNYFYLYQVFILYNDQLFITSYVLLYL